MLHRKCEFYFFCLLFLVLLLPPCSGAIAREDPLVLVVRPDRMPGRGADQVTVMGRDPFNWPTDQADISAIDRPREIDVAFAGLKLNAILMDEELPLAIINGQLAGVGDSINDMVVLEIYKEEVKLEKQGRYHSLRFETVEFDLGPVQGDE